MNRSAALQLFAEYNASMNQKLYSAATRLSDSDLRADKGAYFGSVLGTLNHIVLGDTIWLKRFALHPANFPALAATQAWEMPSKLETLQFPVFADLLAHRTQMDAVITAWTQELTEATLDHDLSYHMMDGTAVKRDFYGLCLHFFNHQTHHRGQATTLLTQMGQEVGVTDLAPLLPQLL